jgi:16S rRNA (guanine527-N7)-methyltransferase
VGTAPGQRIGDGVNAAEIDEAVALARLRPLRPGAAELLAAYVDLLVRWNAHLNLTAIREPSQIVQRHLLECIQCAQVLPNLQTLLDFGSGAGLPGIPIAVTRPEIAVTLGESQGKKAAFLREAIRVLGIEARVYDQRIERMPADRTFEAVALRAVDRMDEAARVARDRVQPSGRLILFATRKTERRLQSSLTGVDWDPRIPIVGLEEGILLLGRRVCST